MFKKHVRLLTVLSFLLLASTVVLAQEEPRGRIGVGFQASFPAWGFSGMVDLTNKLSIQGIFGLLGDLKTYAGRGIYRFKVEPYWNP